MKYTLTIPISTNTYDLLFGYSLTSWCGAFKFWKVNAADIQQINGEYVIQPEIETKNVDVPIPEQEGQYNNYSINMSCVDDVYGVKCRWYVLPLCSIDESSLSWVDKSSCSGVVFLNATKGFDYTGDIQAKKLQKVQPNDVYYFGELIVVSNIKGLQVRDSTNFTENETITATDIYISYNSSPANYKYKATGSFTFYVLDGKLYCDEEIELVDTSNNNNPYPWDSSKLIQNTTIRLVVNGNNYDYTPDLVDVIAVKTIPFKDIFDGIISDEPNEYSINCKISGAQRGYIPSIDELTYVSTKKYKYEDSDITMLFNNVSQITNGTNAYVCTSNPSYSYKIKPNRYSYLSSIPEYPLLWGIDEENNIAIMAIDSDDFKDSIAPINSDAYAESHCCIGREGFVTASRNNYRFS